MSFVSTYDCRRGVFPGEAFVPEHFYRALDKSSQLESALRTLHNKRHPPVQGCIRGSTLA